MPCAHQGNKKSRPLISQRTRNNPVLPPLFACISQCRPLWVSPAVCRLIPFAVTGVPGAGYTICRIFTGQLDNVFGDCNHIPFSAPGNSLNDHLVTYWFIVKAFDSYYTNQFLKVNIHFLWLFIHCIECTAVNPVGL